MAFTRLVFTLILTLVTLPSLYAAEGGNSGGGGLFLELDVMAVRTFLYENCEQFQSFKKHKVDCISFLKKIDEVGTPGQGLSFSDKPLKLDSGKAVDAINFKPAKIQIGSTGWESAGSDVPLKAGM